MVITGTTVNYYFICKRKCWLSYSKVSMEHNSELVKIGKALHEEKYKNELKIENISIDKITDEYITEYKKSDADVEASKAQLIFYMITLKNKGIERKGQLIFHENKKQERKIIKIELSNELIRQYDKIEEDIHELLKMDMPPKFVMKPKCKKCSYYEYCCI